MIATAMANRHTPIYKRLCYGWEFQTILCVAKTSVMQKFSQHLVPLMMTLTPYSVFSVHGHCHHPSPRGAQCILLQPGCHSEEHA